MGKDKNAPKRSLSGYMLFANAKRKEVGRKHPDLKMTEQSSVIGKMWKEATAAQKKPFEEKAAKDKKKYLIALAKYRETPEFKQFQESKGSKGLVNKILKKFGIQAKAKKGRFPSDPNAPKRPLSGFFLFGNDNRARISKKCDGVAAIGKQLGLEWSQASADVKSKYQAKAQKLKNAHQEKMAKYQKTKKAQNYAAARKEFNKMKKKL